MSTATRPIILIIDDSAENIFVLNELLSPHYQVRQAGSGVEGLRMACAPPTPDLLLLDVMMPDVNGYEVLARLRSTPATSDIPVIFLTALSDSDDEERGLGLGAADYIAKPIRPAVVLARVRAQLEAKEARDWMKAQNSTLEAEIVRRMAENDLIQQVSIRALAHLAETRDPETGNHILRTQAYVRHLAVRLSRHPRFAPTLTADYIDLLSRSAPLHDIGKVGIPDYILLKPGKLTPDEMRIMQTHTQLGFDAIKLAERDIEMPLVFLSLAKEIALRHHEKWDGSGYPGGLAGEEIPLSARLMAVADVFDALISSRVYKIPMSCDDARDIIAAGRGKHFDPDITDAFLAGFSDFVAIASLHPDASITTGDMMPAPAYSRDFTSTNNTRALM